MQGSRAILGTSWREWRNPSARSSVTLIDVILLKKTPKLSRAHSAASSGAKKNLEPKARVKRPGVEHKSRAEARAEGTERQRAGEKVKGGGGRFRSRWIKKVEDF